MQNDPQTITEIMKTMIMMHHKETNDTQILLIDKNSHSCNRKY